MNNSEILQYPAGKILKVGYHHAKIIKYLTSGGFAQVYLAEIDPLDEYTQSNVACLKRVIVPDKAGLNVLRAEVDAMRLLKNNKHIVSYIDSNASKYSVQDGSYEVLMLMEYCERGGLIDFLNTRLQNRLRDHEVLNIMSQVCQGIAAMHRLQPPYIHRDIKIENVLISKDGVFKVCDFGSVCGIIRPPKTSQEFNYVSHDILKNTTAQYRAPEMIDLSRGYPIDEKSDIWALGIFLYKLCYYTTPFEREGERAILNGRYQYPAYPIYSDRIKNLIRVLLSQLPIQRPNICQLLEEISRIQGITCPITNFYLERVRGNEYVANQVPDFRVSNQPIPTVQSNVSISQLPISPLKPQMSPTKTHVIPVQYNRTTTDIYAPQIINTSKSFNNLAPTTKTILPAEISSFNIERNSVSPIRVQSSTALYHGESVMGAAHSPSRNSNKIRPSNYVDSQTQTVDVPTLQLSRSSSTSSSISSRYDINENTTGGSIIRKLSAQLKKVTTNDSINTSPVRRRQDTGNSLKFSIGALRSSVSGITSNFRPVSTESKRYSSFPNRRESSFDSANSFNDHGKGEEQEADNRNMHDGNNYDDDNDDLYTVSKVHNNERPLKSHGTFDKSNQMHLGVPNTDTPFQTPSPMKYSVNKDMKDSIQKRVFDLLKVAQKSPVRRTASGYGRYTDKYAEENNIEVTKLEFERPNKMKPVIPPKRSSSVSINERHSSVVVRPLSRGQSSSRSSSAGKPTLPPPVPKKPNFLKIKPPRKPAHLSSFKVPTKSDRNDSISSEILVGMDVDNIEEDFKRRFPSTVS